MKKTVFGPLRFVPALLLVMALGGVAAGQKKGTTNAKSEGKDLNVKIIERNGNEVREIERTYHVNGLDDPERDKLVMRLVDSLKATRTGAGRRQMTIIVDQNDSTRTALRSRKRFDNRKYPDEAYGQQLYKMPRQNFDFWNNPTWQYEFRKGTDAMTDQLHRYKMQIPRDFDRQLVRPFENWSRNINSKPSTIQGLDAFPNNPDRDQLNIRFTAPAKGDVTIVVTNTKGKEVARREINDFSGEFVGQIDLGKKSQGTYFVMVTQNEDGAVKRIVVD